MELEDYLQPEVGIAALITATLFSPRARGFLRRGLVYGTAGALIAGDAVTSFTRAIGQGARRAREATPEGTSPKEGAYQPTPSAENSGGS